jgi:peptidoglycan/LPS O-acetylase OafA/YrhL
MQFLVLYGYVIAYVTDQREHTLLDYSISRLARLYSVVVPAVLATLVLDSVGRALDPDLYRIFDNDHLLLRTLCTLAFANQFWSLDIRFVSNWPYWSISYEFWYYALFACLIFTSGRLRIVLVTLWALLVGAGVILLLPIWLLGVWVYRFTRHGLAISRPLAWALFVLPVPVYIWYRSTGWEHALTGITDTWTVRLTGDIHYLHKARYVLHSYVVALLVAANFIGAHRVLQAASFLGQRTDRLIRWCAEHTFTLYLFHFPVLYFVAAWSPWEATDSRHAALLLGMTLLSTVLFAKLGESRKREWRKLILWLWAMIRGPKSIPNRT